jgi:hypothetical protein
MEKGSFRTEVLVNTKNYNGFYLVRYRNTRNSLFIIFTKKETEDLGLKAEEKYKIYINGSQRDFLKLASSHHGYYKIFKINIFKIPDEEIEELKFEKV